MNRDRTQAFKRVLQRWSLAGMPDEEIANVIHALRDGTTPEELDEALAHTASTGTRVVALAREGRRRRTRQSGAA